MEGSVTTGVDDSDPTEGELLTGEELHEYLRQQNAQRRAALEAREREYNELHKTLDALVKKSRHPLLAPVAGGLGYFKAELRETNRILVLLGDGWFAERSAVQAQGIAERRLEFLKRELVVLREESKQLEDKGELFREEVCRKQPAPTMVTPREKEDEEKKEGCVGMGTVTSGSLSHDSGANTNRSNNAARGRVVEDEEGLGGDGGGAGATTTLKTITQEDLLLLSRLTGKGVGELTTVTPEDELSMEELMAIEAQLEEAAASRRGNSNNSNNNKNGGDDTVEEEEEEDDDAFIDKMLTEAVIAKMERRLKGILEQHGLLLHQRVPAAEKGQGAGKPAAVCYHSPGCIGPPYAPTTGGATTTTAIETSDAGVNSNKPPLKAIKHIDLGDIVERGESTTRGGGGKAAAQGEEGFHRPPLASASAAPSPPLGFTMFPHHPFLHQQQEKVGEAGGGGGDILVRERGVAVGSSRTRTAAPAPAPAPAKKKKKSLFMMEMLGEEEDKE